MSMIDSEQIYRGITNISSEIIEEAENFRPKRNNIVWLHRLAKTAGSVAAVLVIITVVLFSINAAFPAFAEELPLIGQLFRMYNREHKVSVGTYVGTYHGVDEIDSQAAGTNSEFVLTAKEVYSDGTYIHLSFAMEAPEEYLSKYYYIGTEMNATVNGTSAETTDLALWPGEDQFEGTTAVKISSPVDNGETLAVKYEIRKMTGITDGGSGQEEIPGAFSGSLSVIADTTNNQIVSGFTGGSEISVESVETTPSYTKISCTIPFWGITGSTVAYPRLFTVDGTPIPRTETESVIPAEKSIDREAKTITATFFFDGLPKDTDTVILRFLEADVDEDMIFTCSGKERKAGVLGEVTIDLASKEAVPSKTYQEAGWEYASEYCNTFDSLEWHIGFDVLGKQAHVFDLPELFQNGVSLESLQYSKEQGFTADFLSTEPLPKDLSLTISDDENRTVAVADVSQNQVTDNRFMIGYSSIEEMLADKEKELRAMYRDQENAEERISSGLNAVQKTEEGKYYFRVKAKCLPAREVQLLDHVTVTLSDPDTGETLYERRLRFVRKRYGF